MTESHATELITASLSKLMNYTPMAAAYTFDADGNAVMGVDPDQIPIATASVRSETRTSVLNPNAPSFIPIHSPPASTMTPSVSSSTLSSVAPSEYMSIGVANNAGTTIRMDNEHHHLLSLLTRVVPSTVPNREIHIDGLATAFLSQNSGVFVDRIRDLVFDLRGMNPSEAPSRQSRSRSRSGIRKPSLAEVDAYMQRCNTLSKRPMRQDLLRTWTEGVHETSSASMLVALLALPPDSRLLKAIHGSKGPRGLRDRLISYLRLSDE